MATGIYALQVLLSRASHEQQRSGSDNSGLKLWPLARGVAIHLSVLLLLALLGAWVAFAAWLLGVGIFYTFFGALRQILEHRSETADPTINYSIQPHGAYTRLFGRGTPWSADLSRSAHCMSPGLSCLASLASQMT